MKSRIESKNKIEEIIEKQEYCLKQANNACNCISIRLYNKLNRVQQKSLKMFDIQQSRWVSDIESFERWKSFLRVIRSQEVREKVVSYLREIQQRWPQHIQESEIPPV